MFYFFSLLAEMSSLLLHDSRLQYFQGYVMNQRKKLSPRKYDGLGFGGK